MQVNMLEAENHLSSLIVAAEQGEEVVIAPGAWRGKVAYSTDWSSVQTNTEVERLFHKDSDDAASA